MLMNFVGDDVATHENPVRSEVKQGYQDKLWCSILHVYALATIIQKRIYIYIILKNNKVLL